IEVAPGRHHAVPPFDLDAFQIEASLLLDWYVPRMADRKPDEPSRKHYREIIARLHAALDHQNPTLIMRDFHSPNIMWCEGKTAVAQTGLIDFQDALLGPAAYDVISLADDARVDIEPSLRAQIIAAYCDERAGLDAAFDREIFARDAAILSAQRAAKILGIFVRLDERDGKPAYLAHLPRVQKTLQNALTHHALTEFAQWLDDQGVFVHG
ncbi:MAG: phosphotransferase, partial [Ahrensia sp.]